MKNYFWFGIAILVLVLALYVLTESKPHGAPGGENPAAATFYCGDGNTIAATFATSSVALLLSDGRMLSLPQTVSGSGIRYEASTTESDVVFASKGDWGSLTDAAKPTDLAYSACTAARVEASDAPGYDTYTDQSKTFTFAFPTNMSVEGIEPGYGPDWTAPATTSGMVLAKITLPQSFEPGTNFGDAWFSVGVSSDPSAVATCYDTLSGPASTSTPVTIGDRHYTKLLFGGAGAGNRYDTTSYRTVRGNECYAVEYTIHYGVFQNYPPGAVKDFDEQKVENALDEVARSFRFLK